MDAGVALAAREVFEYLDYRSFLRDYYQHRKKHEYGFSYRSFSRRAGCRSTNFPLLVIAGKRNLSPDSAIRFAEACKLEGSARDYFCDLVSFNQAETQREKEHAFEQLTRHAQFRKVHAITEAQAEYFSHWYFVAIRELAARADFVAEAEWIAGQLLPAISTREARRALETLQRLGFLESNEENGLRPTEKLVGTTGPLGHHLVSFHRAMLERASAAIELVDRSERDISALTLCVSQARMQELIEEVRAFRKRLLQLAERDDTPERVVQVGFQVFPLSRGPVSSPTPTRPVQTSRLKPSRKK